MLMLVTTVVVLVIISTTVVISGVSVSNNFKKQEFAIELSYVQDAVNNYKAVNNSYPLLSNSYTVDITGSSVANQFAVEPKTSNEVTLYEIDMQKLGNIETKYGHKNNNNDAYAVSQSTGIVYYMAGINVSGKLYYTLNDELKDLIDYTGIMGNVENKDGIIFYPSTKNWSNSVVNSTVYIPTSYTVNSVQANGTSISITSTSNGYYVYNITNITDPSNSKACNYTVVVSYKKNNISYTQNYSVSNVDVTSPIFEISDVITVEENSLNKDSVKYIKINKASDDLSGIKYIKYETENISATDAPTYFSSNGVPVQNDIVEIPAGIKNITIYVEDNAGNNVVNNITI